MVEKSVPTGLVLAVILAFGSSFTTSIHAAEAEGWSLRLTPYLWLPGIKGTSGSNGGAQSDFDLGFGSLIDNLDLVFMGSFEARKSKWSLAADFAYLKASADSAASVPVPIAPPLSGSVKVDADADATAALLTVLGGYNFRDTARGRVDVIAGARYFDVELAFGLGVNAGGVTAATDLSPSISGVDAVIGVKGHLALGGKWYLPYHAEIGAGKSDFTGQALTGLGYRFGWGDLILQYRYIHWEFSADSPIDAIRLGGPLLAATFRF
jgi:hypothetical protein